MIETIQEVIENRREFALVTGDAEYRLREFPDACVDCIITSPPYWQQRDYAVSNDLDATLIGNEASLQAYIERLMGVFDQLQRVLKPSGSFWLNIGDKYVDKNLLGIPWRVVIAMQERGWLVRNDVIWEKMKGAQPVKDRLRNNYEHFFHLVKHKRYYFDADCIRIKPRLAPQITDDVTISATGVSGKKYRHQIINSPHLSETERQNALNALDEVLDRIRQGEVVDFRMTIRGEQRTLHGSSERLSGRARELEERGFFIMQSYAKGYLPADVWRIAPEDEVKNRHANHYAVFPTELLRVPITSTCPPDGLVLDPFMGVGSTLLAALSHHRRCIGIDISQDYVDAATERIQSTTYSLF